MLWQGSVWYLHLLHLLPPRVSVNSVNSGKSKLYLHLLHLLPRMGVGGVHRQESVWYLHLLHYFHHLHLNGSVKGVNSVNPSYLHYLHTGCKISGVNNQIVHINTTNTEGGTMDHSNASFWDNLKVVLEVLRLFFGDSYDRWHLSTIIVPFYIRR